MLSHRDSGGRILCPEHRVEHSGKNAGLIVIAAELARHAQGEDRDALFEAARMQARRLVANLQREDESTCFTFRPGRHDPFNCSNNVIDGGAASDALAAMVQTFGERLDAREREELVHASVLHAQTYLRYAVLDKGIPAQRAWAMTGVAQAFALARHEVLELAVTEGVGLLEGAQHGDGSYPYHPLEAGGAHAGASDVSSFYQSRVTGFLMFALERIGRDPANEVFRQPLLAGLDFLLALQGPDGIKCGLVEAKPWYWGAHYEVASHPFDVWTLARGWRHFGRARLADGAERAWRAWVAHLASSGEPRSHLPGPGRTKSYQCPMFWAGHASWIARALPDLEAISSRPAPPPVQGEGLEIAVTHFPDASLVRLEDGAVVAWIRGKRPPFNVHHGSPVGAGLVRVYSKAEGCDVHVPRSLDARIEGEWSGELGPFSLARGWRANAKELRFSLWLARNHLRGRRFSAAAVAPASVLWNGVLAFASKLVGSAFDRAPDLALLPDGVEVRSALARRDGTPILDSRLVRRFQVDGEGLAIEEHLESPGPARAMRYRPPSLARALVQEEHHVRYRLR
jgi:hypothetical protein